MSTEVDYSVFTRQVTRLSKNWNNFNKIHKLIVLKRMLCCFLQICYGDFNLSEERFLTCLS